jgi:hypothetical protein
VLTDFTAVNQSTVKFDQTAMGIHMWTDTAVTGGDAWHLLTKPVSDTTFTVVARLNDNNVRYNFNGCGLVLRDATGKMITLEHVYASGSALEFNKWNSLTAFSANITASMQTGGAEYTWFRLDVTPTTITSYVSLDGIAWKLHLAATGTDRSFIGTITEVGVGIKNSSTATSGGRLSVHVLSFQMALPSAPVQSVTTTGTVSPTWKGARVGRDTTAFTMTAGTDMAVQWNASRIDTNSFWAAGTPSRLTIPAGVTKVRLRSRVTPATSMTAAIMA